MSVFVIAEAGSSHDNDLNKGYRLIEAAKECGADAVKFQWTQCIDEMCKRRGVGPAAREKYEHWLLKPVHWLMQLRYKCNEVGIEFMCSCFGAGDIFWIDQYVKRFKISAYECEDEGFVMAHKPYGKETIISSNPKQSISGWFEGCKNLHCISEYPTPVEHAQLSWIRRDGYDGFSDHTANVLTGAAAVAAGARIIESHIRLQDTSKDNPDYPHSLVADFMDSRYSHNQDRCYREYVQNIRTVERML